MWYKEVEGDICPINQKFGALSIGGKARLFTSQRYKQCKAWLASEFTSIQKPLEGPYKVTIEAWQYTDVDSYIKVVLDALQVARVITDDKEIIHLYYKKHKQKRNEQVKMSIKVETIASA